MLDKNLKFNLNKLTMKTFINKKLIKELQDEHSQEEELIKKEELKFSLLKEGHICRYEKRMLKCYGLRVGSFLQYKKGDVLEGQTFIVVGIINSIVHGIGINNDHDGYIHPERMIKITRKDLFKEKK